MIPADNKPIMRAMVADIVADTLKNMNLQFPDVSQKEKAEMAEAKKILENV